MSVIEKTHRLTFSSQHAQLTVFVRLHYHSGARFSYVCLWHTYCRSSSKGTRRDPCMESILRTSRHLKPSRLANIDWLFYIFWLAYFSIVLGIVAYFIG